MPQPQQSSPVRVLLADASAVTRAEVAKVFAAQAVAVIQCARAADVVPFACEHQADVVLLDATMAELDAAQCVGELDRNTNTRSTVVVLTCPRDIDVTRLAALEATGALLVLVKPLTRDGVLQAMRQALAESGERRSKSGAGRRHAA